MTPLPLDPAHARNVPDKPGCYLVYLDKKPFYAGRSFKSIRVRLCAHAAGRGSKKIAAALRQRASSLWFEYYEVREDEGNVSDDDVARLEFFFMFMHAGEMLSANLRADGASLYGQKRSRRRR